MASENLHIYLFLYQVSLISHNKSAIFSHLKMTFAVSQEIHFLADDLRKTYEINVIATIGSNFKP